MTIFPFRMIDTAPVESKLALEEATHTFGSVPALQAHMAESPELLAGDAANG
ncbi:hypothetical protein ACVBGC_32135 [Burkholderia stagnalis]